ncbi:MAG: PDGLE domain-containing protein [Candidatus Methanospirareceae archaeon]
MEPWLKKTLIVIAIFVAIVPLGILGTWNCGDAWGEWGEVQDPEHGINWTPQAYFGAPLPDYNVEGWDSMLMASVGYWISAIIGIALTMLVTLGIVKALEMRRE